jgi:hypothetical protein
MRPNANLYESCLLYLTTLLIPHFLMLCFSILFSFPTNYPILSHNRSTVLVFGERNHCTVKDGTNRTDQQIFPSKLGCEVWRAGGRPNSFPALNEKARKSDGPRGPSDKRFHTGSPVIRRATRSS